MADLRNMTIGEALRDANVGEYIKALGISIAEAQQALDLNSLSMLGEYLQPREGLDGQSLLQLGLSPPFYHYQHADITVQLHVTMKVGEEETFGLGVKADFGFAKGGGTGSGTERRGQIELSRPGAKVTVNGTELTAEGADLEAAAEDLAAKLRKPQGRFDRVFVKGERREVQVTLAPPGATNPIVTTQAVAFLRTSTPRTALIRIRTLPASGSEPFTLAENTRVDVDRAADLPTYARAVASAINALEGFSARLVNDVGGQPAPESQGAVGIVLFDTGSDVLKPAALAELETLSRMLRGETQHIIVQGFTDREGTEANNQRLGDRRAAAVREQLVHLGIDARRILTPSSTGEERWRDLQASDSTRNEQFRRAEVSLQGSNDFFILVEEDGATLQETPTPDARLGSPDNGFVLLTPARPTRIDGTSVTLRADGTEQEVTLRENAVSASGVELAEGSAEAYAHNLAAEINNFPNGAFRATRRGTVVVLARRDDRVMLELMTIDQGEIGLQAGVGARISQPLQAPSGSGGGEGGSQPSNQGGEDRITFAAGATFDWRQSRMFESSMTGNSSITARLVAIPAPPQFLDQVGRYLAQLSNGGSGSGGAGEGGGES